MLIDKFLSRFKIKAKVLIVVLPFIATISAVGLTGLHASGLLQGRMEISNGVLQSLTGFKDLYGSMDAFLQDSNADARDNLLENIRSQKASLDDILEKIGEGEGRRNLVTAAEGASGIASTVDILWALHKREVASRQVISNAQQVLAASRDRTALGAQELEEKVKGDEAKATAILRAADRLMKGGDAFQNVTNIFNGTQTVEDKLKAVADGMPQILQAQRLVELSASQSQKDLVQSISQVIGDLKAQVASQDPTGSEDTIRLNRLGARFRLTALDVHNVATDMMRRATTMFVELDGKTAQTNAVVAKAKQLEGSIYDLQLQLARFAIVSNREEQMLLDKRVATVAENLHSLATTAKGVKFSDDIVAQVDPALVAIQSSGKDLVAIMQQRDTDYATARSQLDAVWKELTSFAELQKQTAGAERDQANSISVGTTGLGILVSILGGIALVLTLQRPIAQVTGAMRRLADGALDTAIAGEQRHDEIGDIARALGIFKENAISKIRIEEQSEEERMAAERERQRNDAEKREMDRQIEYAVNQLAAGLERMSQGDISTTIETPFIGRLEQLRQDFNGSMLRLQATMSQIRDNVQMIQGNGNQMAQSAEDLSKRTEQQAASLEETAAAVDEITVTVRSSAERAKDADHIVREAKRSADDSAVVVNNAIDAMGRIEEASRQIEQIIGVIDEIAFQTNLLALNAGIEAARAGEAGKGFAVVAMEVRELAQRSAAAAQEIKGLINKSTNEVSSGSQFVQETGTVLAKISAQIVTISQHVEMIARASYDQSSALQEVNSTVNQMDQMTQQNAAMVEETTAASRELANEADALLDLVRQFKIAGASLSPRLRHAA